MNPIKNVYVIFVLIFIAVGVSFGATPNTKVKLALNWKAEPEFAGFYTAQINKIYEKNGIEAEILQGGAGTPTVQMLAAQQVEFGIVSGDEVIIARSRGADVVALFAVFQKAPYAFMLRDESPIADMKGLFNSSSTIAVVKGLPYVSFLEKKYGFKKVKIVPYAGGITNFLSDKNFVQQSFISSEPLLASKQGIKTKTFLVADAGFNPYTVVLATNGETLKKKPELVKAMVQAAKEGWESYIADPNPTHELIAKLNPAMTVESMNEMHKIEVRFIQSEETKKHGLGYMNEKRWKDLASQLKELGLIEKTIPANQLFLSKDK